MCGRNWSERWNTDALVIRNMDVHLSSSYLSNTNCDNQVVDRGFTQIQRSRSLNTILLHNWKQRNDANMARFNSSTHGQTSSTTMRTFIEDGDSEMTPKNVKRESLVLRRRINNANSSGMKSTWLLMTPINHPKMDTNHKNHDLKFTINWLKNVTYVGTHKMQISNWMNDGAWRWTRGSGF